MKRLSWPGAIVVAGSTVLSWMTGSREAPPHGAARQVTESARAANNTESTAVSIDAMRLHDWNPRPSSPARPARDIFAFKRRAAQPAPPAPAAAVAAVQAPQPLALFKLIGFAEDKSPDGAIRTAIISGPGQLYLVKEGETVASIYRVETIAPDGVELLDTTGGPSVRLALR
jgi:hypothetical protein